MKKLTNYSFCLNKSPRIVSPSTRFISLYSLLLIASFLSAYDGFSQTVKISLPLDRTVFQQSTTVDPSTTNRATFQLAGQVKNYYPSSNNPTPEYQIEHLNINGVPISIAQSWTSTDVSYSATGFFNKTITLTTGWYRITVRYPGSTNTIKVGVGEVIFAAGQSNAQGVELGGSKGTVPNLGSDYDCINAVNENGFCKNTYKFPEFTKMQFSGTNRASMIAPNGNETLWCYQALGKNIVDRKSTSTVTTPVMFFNAGSGGTGMDNWKASAEFPNQGTPNPLTGSVLNCEYNDPDPIKVPQWNRDGPGDGPLGHPYLGLRNSLNYYGGMLGIRGILWHQGETETYLKLTGSNDAGDYQGKLQYVIQKTKDHFSNNISWAISKVSSINLLVDEGVRNTQAAVKTAANDNSRVTWGAYYSDQIEYSDIEVNSNRLADKTHFNSNGLKKLAQLYDTGTFNGNVGELTNPQDPNSPRDATPTGGDILSLKPVEFNNRPSLAVNVTRPTTGEITMTVSGVHSGYFWVKNEGKKSDSPSDKRSQSITVNNTGTDRWRCYVLDSKGNVAITQEVALPVQQAIILGPGDCPSGIFNPVAKQINCEEISGWVFRSNTNGSFGVVEIHVDGQFKERIIANSSKPFGTTPSDEGYIYNVPANASWRDGINHVISVRLCNSNTDFASNNVNCPAGNDINITDKTGLIDVSSAGGTGSFIVNSTNANWNTGGTSWATVSPLSGSSGATAVTVTFNANTDSVRSASLNVFDVNAGLLRTVYISQQGSSGGTGCANGSSPFSITTASYNTSTKCVNYQFNANNLSNANWSIKQGTTIVHNGSLPQPITMNSGTVNCGVTLPDGTYDFVLNGVSCSGTASKSFTVSGGGTGGGTSICSNISTTNCGNASEGYTHTINIPTAGDYKFKITYASGESNATGSISVNSEPAIQFSVGPSTGSWTPSSEVFVGTVQKTLSAGNHNIRIAGVNGVSGSNFAHNKLCAESISGGGGGGGNPSCSYTNGQFLTEWFGNEIVRAYICGTKYYAKNDAGYFKSKAWLTGTGRFTAAELACFEEVNPGCGGLRIASSLIETDNGLEVFPNPTNGKIKVSFTLQKDENVWFNLYDTQGKNLQLNDFEGKKGRNEVELDLQNYSFGTYFIDLQYNQKLEVRKVMKVN